MKNSFYISMLCGLLWLSPIYAQVNSSNTSLISDPKEEVYLHLSSNELWVGEYLYFTVYNKETIGGRLSNLSKVAYVEIVNAKKESVLKKKIRLHEGIGQGDLFLSTELPTGPYKLVAYTQWMRNGGETNLFAEDIAIINPYTSKTLFTKWTTEKKAEATHVQNANKDGEIRLSKDTIGVRSKLEIDFLAENGNSIDAVVSVSIRKKNPIQPAPTSLAHQVTKMYSTKKGSSGADLFIPEFRGELLSGVVLNKQTEKPVENVLVSMAIPDRGIAIKMAKTNELGQFFFNVADAYTSDEANFQIIGEGTDGLKMVLDRHISPNFDFLKIDSLELDKSMMETISQRSVYNQIENAFFEVKPDSVLVPAAIADFFADKATTYLLDDYNRFETVKETFVEYIDDAWVRTVNNTEQFVVRPYEYSLLTEAGPLLLIDGIVVQDPLQLLYFPARMIDKIQIVQDKYFLGSGVFQGIIAVETKAASNSSAAIRSQALQVETFAAQPEKQYYFQQYNKGQENSSRIPDYRTQLLWVPQLKIAGKSTQLEVFSGDLRGAYEISIQGFTRNGKVISAYRTFWVR